MADDKTCKLTIQHPSGTPYGFVQAEIPNVSLDKLGSTAGWALTVLKKQCPAEPGAGSGGGTRTPAPASSGSGSGTGGKVTVKCRLTEAPEMKVISTKKGKKTVCNLQVEDGEGKTYTATVWPPDANKASSLTPSDELQITGILHQRDQYTDIRNATIDNIENLLAVAPDPEPEAQAPVEEVDTDNLPF